MIEINQRAKVDDPWDTPPLLTVEAFHGAREAGKVIQLFQKSDDGEWRPYDYLAANRKYTDSSIQTYLSKAHFQLRAHAFNRVIVYQIYSRRTIGENQCVVRMITAASREKLDAGVEKLKISSPSYQAVSTTCWHMIELTQEKELVYDLI